MFRWLIYLATFPSIKLHELAHKFCLTTYQRLIYTTNAYDWCTPPYLIDLKV